MVFCNSSTHLPCQKALYVFLLSTTTIILSFFLPSSYSLYFNFPQFGPNTPNITNYGDAFPSNRAIELTENKNDVPANGSTGRAIYSKPVHLWDSQTGRLTDFTTHFSFIMNSLNTSTSGGGDGLAFFLAANGFSAATRTLSETHQILSWNFTSTLEEVTVGGEQPKKENNKRSTRLVVGMVVGGAILIIGLGSLLWFGLRRSLRFTKDEDELPEDELPDVSRFTHNQLVLATNNFSEDGKLGEGSFGSVYKGFFSELNLKVAVRTVSRDSKKGKKEYISWVKIISQLRHRNLVRLLGWCHERGDFLLVYEFMPNGSLASRLFGGKSLLPWALRYKIAKGLASSLEYLQEVWERCVVHGDIKSSNVMLDSDFNAKLGDFHLARLVGHGLGSETTDIVGTIGYLAPECIITGKASKESDVYSFGVVVLEIACGRRAVELEAEESRISMVEWVWELYGRGNLLDAADQRLNNEFDEEQMERLMVLGLWCAHPVLNLRPSMSQVIGVLSWEGPSPVPSLPYKMLMDMNFTPQLSDTIDATCSSSTDSSNSSATDSLYSPD